MSHIFSYQLRRWSLTFVLVSIVCIVSVATMVQPKESPEPAFTLEESVFHLPSYEEPIEARLQSKGEKVLEGLGERAPVVSVTLEINRDGIETNDISYDKDEPVVDSEQETNESLAKGESPYVNQKKAVNYKVGERQVKRVSMGPRVEKIHCLALVSAKNESRCQEIEKALSVALGLDLARGDQIQVMVK